jgi:hypothetical protein
LFAKPIIAILVFSSALLAGAGRPSTGLVGSAPFAGSPAELVDPLEALSLSLSSPPHAATPKVSATATVPASARRPWRAIRRAVVLLMFSSRSVAEAEGGTRIGPRNCDTNRPALLSL